MMLIVRGLLCITMLIVTGCQTSSRNTPTYSTWVHDNPNMMTSTQLSKDSGECNMLAMDRYKKVSQAVLIVAYSESCMFSRGWKKQ